MPEILRSTFLKSLLLCALVLCFADGEEVFAYNKSASIIDFSGDVAVYPSGKGDAVAPDKNMDLKIGDRVKTGNSSFADISFGTGQKNIVKVDSNSHVAIVMGSEGDIELLDGEVYTLLRGLDKGETFIVKTPAAVCGARGTGWKTTTDGKTTEVTAFENKIFVKGVKNDGTPMEAVFWVDEGFMRNILKNDEPGQLKKVLEKVLQDMKDKMEPYYSRNKGGFPLISEVFDLFGAGLLRYKKAGDREKIIDRSERASSKRREQIVEDKQETRVEEKVERQSRGDGYLTDN